LLVELVIEDEKEEVLPLWSAQVTFTADSTYCPFARVLLIALMMEAVRTSETSVNFNVTTRRYIPED
jgi:hypothetical protein